MKKNEFKEWAEKNLTKRPSGKKAMLLKDVKRGEHARMVLDAQESWDHTYELARTLFGTVWS